MSEKVLIVDPDLEDRDFISNIMKEQGWEVYKAVTLKDAVLYLKNYKIDLVLTNNLIPTLHDGQRFVNEIRKHSKDIYIVIVSPVKAKNTIVDLINLGANDYLVKPLDKDTLLWKLNIPYKSIAIKDFARINIPANPELSECFFDLKGAITGVGEGFLDIFISCKIEPEISLKMDPAFFKLIGIDKSSVVLKVKEVQQLKEKIQDYSFVARCVIENLSDEDEILLRRWLLSSI